MHEKVEVDCIIENLDSDCFPIEIKVSATVTSADFKGLSGLKISPKIVLKSEYCFIAEKKHYPLVINYLQYLCQLCGVERIEYHSQDHAQSLRDMRIYAGFGWIPYQVRNDGQGRKAQCITYLKAFI